MGNSSVDFDQFAGTWSTNVSKYMRAFNKQYKATGEVTNPHDAKFALNEDDLKRVETFLNKVNSKLKMPTKTQPPSANDYAQSALKARKDARKILLK